MTYWYCDKHDHPLTQSGECSDCIAEGDKLVPYSPNCPHPKVHNPENDPCQWCCGSAVADTEDK